MDAAECQGLETDLWFPVGKEPAGPAALAACQRCPVSGECLSYSLRGFGEQIESGYWAGMGEEERQREKRRRNRHLTAVAS
jgi:hypothetical protein